VCRYCNKCCNSDAFASYSFICRGSLLQYCHLNNCYFLPNYDSCNEEYFLDGEMLCTEYLISSVNVFLYNFLLQTLYFTFICPFYHLRPILHYRFNMPLAVHWFRIARNQQALYIHWSIIRGWVQFRFSFFIIPDDEQSPNPSNSVSTIWAQTLQRHRTKARDCWPEQTMTSHTLAWLPSS
jgi:hypothetical protein